jgi:hypothetical protein
MNAQQQMLEVYLHEYEKLKDEQTQRIGFRDNLLYVTLGLFGTVISFALSNKTNYYALLVLPYWCRKFFKLALKIFRRGIQKLT